MTFQCIYFRTFDFSYNIVFQQISFLVWKFFLFEPKTPEKNSGNRHMVKAAVGLGK